MLMKMRSKMQNEKGFTLVELMVVVVILGILVAIAIPVYNNITTKAELSAIMANVRTIDGAVMQITTTQESDVTGTTESVEGKLSEYVNGYEDLKPGTYGVKGTNGQLHTYKAYVKGTDKGGLTAATEYTLADLQDLE